MRLDRFPQQLQGEMVLVDLHQRLDAMAMNSDAWSKGTRLALCC